MRIGKQRTFSVSLHVALVSSMCVLALFPLGVFAQCPTFGDEGATPGITRFNTVKNQMWYNDGLWWGAFSDNTDGIFIYTLSGVSTTQVGIVDGNVNGIPDVLWDGTNLFVLVWKSVSLATFYKYDYDSIRKTYTLDNGFPVNIPLNGSSTAAIVMDKDSTGKLWATYTGTQGGLADGLVHVIWTTSADHTVWNTTGSTLELGLAANTTEISAITHFGGNKIGIAWSNQPGKQIAFRYHNDGDAETNWSPKEIVDSGLGPRGLGPVADDHLSIKAAPDGRIFLVAKDNDNDGSPQHATEGRLWLYIRTTAGVWGSKTIVQPDFSQLPTRPVLLLDITNNVAYVIYHDESATGFQRDFITHTSMDNPTFDFPCVFLATPSNNPTSTKQNLTSSMGLMAASSTGATGTNEIVFRAVLLPTPGFEADVAPRPTGSNNGSITIADWVQVGRFAAGLDTPDSGVEFQKADCAPRSTLGDGRITISDWVQAGRYAAGLDPVVSAGGPSAPATPAVNVSVRKGSQATTTKTFSALSIPSKLHPSQILTLRPQAEASVPPSHPRAAYGANLLTREEARRPNLPLSTDLHP